VWTSTPIAMAPSSIYYFYDNYNLDDPYPSGLGGATVPGPNNP
jgi:hypothetical protein